MLLDVAIVIVLVGFSFLGWGRLFVVLHGATGRTSTVVVDGVLLTMVVVSDGSIVGSGCSGGCGATTAIQVSDVVAVAVGLVCRANNRHRLVILPLVLLVLLGIFVEGRWDVVQVFAKMPAAALAVASFEGQVVALLGPQVLQPLLLAPAAGTSTGAQVRQHRLLKLLETIFVHPASFLAALIVAQHSHSVVGVVGIYRLVREATGPGRTAFL